MYCARPAADGVENPLEIAEDGGIGEGGLRVGGEDEEFGEVLVGH